MLTERTAATNPNKIRFMLLSFHWLKFDIALASSCFTTVAPHAGGIEHVRGRASPIKIAA
jgi:hypothetical protein